MSTVKWLEEWFCAHCTNDWEHCFGVKIETLDNPGWAVSIDIADTELENKSFEKLELDNGDSDWMVCRIEEKCFKGFGDPFKLDSILLVFKEWAEGEK